MPALPPQAPPAPPVVPAPAPQPKPSGNFCTCAEQCPGSLTNNNIRCVNNKCVEGLDSVVIARMFPRGVIVGGFGPRPRCAACTKGRGYVCQSGVCINKKCRRSATYRGLPCLRPDAPTPVVPRPMPRRNFCTCREECQGYRMNNDIRCVNNKCVTGLGPGVIARIFPRGVTVGGFGSLPLCSACNRGRGFQCRSGVCINKKCRRSATYAGLICPTPGPPATSVSTLPPVPRPPVRTVPPVVPPPVVPPPGRTAPPVVPPPGRTAPATPRRNFCTCREECKGYRGNNNIRCVNNKCVEGLENSVIDSFFPRGVTVGGFGSLPLCAACNMGRGFQCRSGVCINKKCRRNATFAGLACPIPVVPVAASVPSLQPSVPPAPGAGPSATKPAPPAPTSGPVPEGGRTVKMTTMTIAKKPIKWTATYKLYKRSL